MSFADPSAAAWLLLVPLVVSFTLWRRRERQGFRDALLLTASTRRLSRLTGRGRDAVVVVAGALAVGLLAVAALRPQIAWESREPEFERQDLVLILDRSASMRARDVAPSRFGRALDELRFFLRDKPPSIDRVALVGFSGTSLTLSHLTRDVGSLLFFLDWIGEDEAVHYGTDMAAAIGSALEVVQRDPSASRPVFVLVSDGDDHGPRLEEKLASLREAGIRLHCIGIGTAVETPPIPAALGRAETTYLEDEQGRPLTTQFDPATLRRLAGDSGGRYFASTTGRELLPALREIVDAERRQVGWKDTSGERGAHRPLLLAAALAVVVLMVTT